MRKTRAPPKQSPEHRIYLLAKWLHNKWYFRNFGDDPPFATIGAAKVSHAEAQKENSEEATISPLDRPHEYFGVPSSVSWSNGFYASIDFTVLTNTLLARAGNIQYVIAIAMAGFLGPVTALSFVMHIPTFGYIIGMTISQLLVLIWMFASFSNNRSAISIAHSIRQKPLVEIFLDKSKTFISGHQIRTYCRLRDLSEFRLAINHRLWQFEAGLASGKRIEIARLHEWMIRNPEMARAELQRLVDQLNLELANMKSEESPRANT